MEAFAQTPTPPSVPAPAPAGPAGEGAAQMAGEAAGEASASFDPVMFAVLMVIMFMVMRYVPRLMAGVPFVDPGVVKRMMDEGKDHLIIDVRSEGEFIGRMGHVPGSLNLPLNEIRQRLADAGGALEPHKNTQVFIMCRNANRSGNAARVLKKAGFTNLAVVIGGMARWNRAKLPVEGKS